MVELITKPWGTEMKFRIIDTVIYDQDTMLPTKWLDIGWNPDDEGENFEELLIEEVKRLIRKYPIPSKYSNGSL